MLYSLSEEMVASISAINAMITIGINIHVEILVSLHQRFGIFSRITEMNVIIGKSMTDKK